MVISDVNHPDISPNQDPQRYAVMCCSTSDAYSYKPIRLPTRGLEQGMFRRPVYAMPWSLHTVEDPASDHGIAILRAEGEITEEAFTDRLPGYYHSGDLATVDEHGHVAIRDRKKDIIVSGGENISSVELEDVLYDHPDVARVAVIPSPSDEWGETPKAFVVPASGDPANPGVTQEDLVAFTRERLANYKAITRVEFVEDLPTTATGKVRKFELRDREWADEEDMVGKG
jgi:acyl-CoA synthetase (AMP-forming)/AMP-acid ligase II